MPCKSSTVVAEWVGLPTFSVDSEAYIRRDSAIEPRCASFTLGRTALRNARMLAMCHVLDSILAIHEQ